MYTENALRMIQSQKILLRFRYGPLMIRRNGSWVKSQLSDRGTTRIHIRLQWDTRVGYNVYELYCPLESIGQFGPSADPAIVAILHYCSRQLHRLQQIPSKRIVDTLFVQKLVPIYEFISMNI